MSFLSPTLKLENLPIYPELSLDYLSEENRYNRSNIVARWCVLLDGKVNRIEFEHGKTSGRRMIWVDGKEVIRRDWMFKLVGEDTFQIGKHRCIIRVDPAPGFAYDYSLSIDGKTYQQIGLSDGVENEQAYRTWMTKIGEQDYWILLELDSLNVYLNNELRSETGEFVDGGTDTKFVENEIEFVIQVRSSGNRREGIIYSLIVNGEPIKPCSLQAFLESQFENFHHESDKTTSGS